MPRLKSLRRFDDVLQLRMKSRPMRLLQYFANLFLRFLPDRQRLADKLLSAWRYAQRSTAVMRFRAQHNQACFSSGLKPQPP